MSEERFFKKDKSKFKVGNSDVVFKYNKGRHKIEDLENRFVECDKNGKTIAKKTANKKENK